MKKILLTSALLLAALGAHAQLHVDLRVGTAAANFGDQHLKLGCAPVSESSIFSADASASARGFTTRTRVHRPTATYSTTSTPCGSPTSTSP